MFASAERPALTAGLFGAVHMLVDLASVSTLFCVLRTSQPHAGWAAILILSYDFIAFGLQMFLGATLDRFARLTGVVAAFGCAVTALGAWLAASLPVMAVAAVAFGNAVFHVGGGTACLRLARGKAVWVGIFVAPGAIGLFLGKLLGGTALYTPWALTLLLAAGALISLSARPPQRSGEPFPEVKGLGLVASALLLTVALRSLVGFSVSYPWAAGWQQAVWLTVAAVVGKSLGGALGDKVGWRALSVVGLLVSAPLLAIGSGVPALAIAGSLCFNLTMAITLAGMAYLLPGREGLAFGLTTAALVAGQMPAAISPWKPLLESPWAVAFSILLSAAALWFALGRLENNIRKEALTDVGKVGVAAP